MNLSVFSSKQAKLEQEDWYVGNENKIDSPGWDEMKCNAQPCESCWLVADLKLLCPHSLRSSRSPSPSRSLPGSNGYAPGRTLLYNGTPFLTVDVRASDGFARSRQRYSSSGHRLLHRTALRVQFLVRILDVSVHLVFISTCVAPPRVVSHLHPYGGRCLIQRSDAFIPHSSWFHTLRAWNSSTAGESGW